MNSGLTLSGAGAVVGVTNNGSISNITNVNYPTGFNCCNSAPFARWVEHARTTTYSVSGNNPIVMQNKIGWVCDF